MKYLKWIAVVAVGVVAVWVAVGLLTLAWLAFVSYGIKHWG